MGTYFFMTGIIMLLATVFDISEKMSDFLTNKAPLKAILLDYYVNFIIYYGNLFSSMIIFVSVIWFTSKMAQDTEIIPIWNSGRPFSRFIRPYMIAATFLMILSLFLNHFIVPNANKKRLAFEDKYYRNTIVVTDYHAEYPGNVCVYFKYYNGESNMIDQLIVEKWDKNREIVSFLKADKAKNRKNSKKWMLYNYYERKVGNKRDRIIEGKEKDTTFQFQVDEMATRENVAEAMDYFSLKKFIERERKKGSPMVSTYEIELYQRTSYPFATYVLTIIGVAVSSRKKRGGIGVSIAMGLAIIFIYIFAMKVMTVAAMNVGFPAWLAVWVPNILFAGIAYLLYRYAKT